MYDTWVRGDTAFTTGISWPSSCQPTLSHFFWYFMVASGSWHSLRFVISEERSFPARPTTSQTSCFSLLKRCAQSSQPWAAWKIKDARNGKLRKVKSSLP